MPVWTWLSTRVAHVAATHLPAGARVFVISLKPVQPLIAALKKRGLDAVAMPLMPQRVRHAVAIQPHDLSVDMLILVMSLSNVKEADRDAVMEFARELAPLTLLVDWQRAERNLEVPAEFVRRLFFRVTRPRAWRCFLASYDAAGGLNALLYAWRRRGRVVARHSCLTGCVGLALVAWERVAADSRDWVETEPT